MASIECNLTVAVERAIHDVFKETAQKLMDQHGVMVNDIVIEWIDTSRCGHAPSATIRSMIINTKTVAS